MNALKAAVLCLAIALLAVPSMAQEKVEEKSSDAGGIITKNEEMSLSKATMETGKNGAKGMTMEAPASPEIEKKKEDEGLVVGKNLKVGMSLTQAFTLLGVPDMITMERGTEARVDSFSVAYPKQGVVIHALNGKKAVEGIEILPTFKGTFAKGIKLGASFKEIIETYGTPDSYQAQMARYPEIGLYFVLKEEALVSAKTFKTGSPILDLQLINK